MSLTEYTVDTPEAFVADATAFIADIVREAIQKDGRCILGLSGGSTPGPVYTALGQEKGIDWSKVWIFLVDDRCVPADNPKSNQFLLRSTLLKYAPIPESQIIVPDMSLGPDEAATKYGQEVIAITRAGMPAPRVHLLVLGLGEDGHIASLFPPVSENAFSMTGAIHTTTNTFDIPDRISVTLPVLTSAKQALFLLKGEKKIAVWEEMVESGEDEKRWPAKGVIEKVETTVIALT